MSGHEYAGAVHRTSLGAVEGNKDDKRLPYFFGMGQKMDPGMFEEVALLSLEDSSGKGPVILAVVVMDSLPISCSLSSSNGF